jgi:DNA-binding NarL/FixJ family response regulator
MSEIRVLLLDDHDLFRSGLSSVLGAERDIEVVAQASGGRAGVRLADELRPDVVLMHLRMTDLTGSEAIQMIVESHPSIRVIALTVLPRDEDIAGAVHAGACGYLAKDTPVEEIVFAIRAAAHGGEPGGPSGVREPRRPLPQTGGGSAQLQPPTQ